MTAVVRLQWLILTLVAVAGYVACAWLAAGGEPRPMAFLSIAFIIIATWSRSDD